MNPVALNTLITSISNHFFCSLKEKDFFNLALFLSLLSKEMLDMNVVRDLCRWEERMAHKGHRHDKGQKGEKDHKEDKDAKEQ